MKSFRYAPRPGAARRHALRKGIRAALLCSIAAGFTVQAGEAAFPAKTVRIIVPAPPGGGTDILARTLAQRFTEVWGVQTIADNRPGASGIIGSDIVAKAAPDGHTLLLAFTTHVTNPSMQANMPYDTINDFAPVSRVAVIPNVLVVHPSLPVRTVKEVISLAKSRPGQLAYATAGAGSATHLSAVLLESMAGVKLLHIPYKGAAPAQQDLLGGQVTLMFGNMASTMPHVQTGRLRAIAVTGAARSAAAPHLPTIAETGLPGYESSAWFALLAPGRTPAAVVNRINAETVAALNLPQVKDRLAAQGAEALPGTPAELGAYIRAELVKWGKVIREAGIRAE
jgi:tripartite-type tricarboxylate transporter receptor subunit TctC